MIEEGEAERRARVLEVWCLITRWMGDGEGGGNGDGGAGAGAGRAGAAEGGAGSGAVTDGGAEDGLIPAGPCELLFSTAPVVLPLCVRLCPVDPTYSMGTE